MIIARCESLILEKGMEDAINRCNAYVKAGADGIMIHSCKGKPDEVIEFCKRFRKTNKSIPIVVVPTTYNTITEEELARHGVNIVIHANHLIRSMFPAMQSTAEQILKHGRSLEASENCLPIKQILTLIRIIKEKGHMMQYQPFSPVDIRFTSMPVLLEQLSCMADKRVMIMASQGTL